MCPVRRARRLFPVQAANPCPPLPLVDGSPVLRVLPVDLTPDRSSTLLAEPPTWVSPQDPPGPPKFSTLLSTHPALFVDPGRPSGTSPSRSLCGGFWHVNTIAICIQLLRGCIKLQGVRSPLRSMWFPVYASTGSFGLTPSFQAATLGTGGWLGLTRQGLSPCKKRQASLGALTDGPSAVGGSLARRLHALVSPFTQAEQFTDLRK